VFTPRSYSVLHAKEDAAASALDNAGGSNRGFKEETKI
jgi:hypothetical protein